MIFIILAVVFTAVSIITDIPDFISAIAEYEYFADCFEDDRKSEDEE